MSDSDDLVILTPPTTQKGFKGHLLISSERIKREPGVQIGMVSPSQPSSSNQPGLSVPVLNSNPRPAPSGGLRTPVVPRHPKSVAPGPRLNPALQNPSLYFRSINPREQLDQGQQLQSQQQSQQQLQQASAAQKALSQATSAAMPGPPQGQLPGQPATSFVINSGGAPRVEQNAPVLLDSRLILSHVSPLENNDSHQILNQIKYPHEASAIIKCIECCDQFYFRHCYQHHRERQVVAITYNCEICMRKLSFHNKCALFAHVRTHKLGSVDPSKLTICSLPLAKMKTLSEASLKQLVTQLDQAHGKYQEALKALNACLPPGSQAQGNTFGLGAAAAAAAAAAGLPGVSGSGAGAAGPSGVTAHGAGSSAVVPITIDLEEGGGAGPGSNPPSASADATGGPADAALDVAVVASSAAGAAGDLAAATVSSSGVADSKDASAFGGGGGIRPTAVVEPAIVQAAAVTSGAGDSAPPDVAPGPAVQPQHHLRQQNCTVCHGSFDSLAAHLGDSLKECPLCKKFVPESPCALKAHYRLHLATRGPCPECGEEIAPSGASPLDREVAMRVHLRSQCLHLQRSKVFICLKCEYPPRAFSAIRQLADHIIHSHTEKFFKCTVCTLAFRHTNQLAAHLEKEHSSQLTGKPAKIFKCPICDLIFNDSGHLGKHLLTHLPHQLFCKSAMAFRCLDSCRQIFLEKKGLKRHLNTCPSTAVTDSNLPCVLCEINVSFFSSLGELRSHEETHLSQTAGGWCPTCETEVDANLLDHLRQEQKRLESKDQPPQPPAPQAPQPKPQSLPKSQHPKQHQMAKQQQQPKQPKLLCHCGQELPDAAAVTKHMDKAVHPIATESHLTEPQSGLGVFYKCRDCPVRLTYTELTEHIFAKHPALCYLCNAAQLTAAHLLGCLATGRMEGLVATESGAAVIAEAAEAAEAAAGASTSNDDDVASEGAASSTAGSASASGGAASTSASTAVQFCPLCLDPVDGPADLQRHTQQRHGTGRPAGFKRPAERDQQQKLEGGGGGKVARTSAAEAAGDAVDTAASSGLACGECGMRFLTKSALQVHRLSTRHDT